MIFSGNLGWRYVRVYYSVKFFTFEIPGEVGSGADALTPVEVCHILTGSCLWVSMAGVGLLSSSHLHPLMGNEAHTSLTSPPHLISLYPPSLSHLLHPHLTSPHLTSSHLLHLPHLTFFTPLHFISSHLTPFTPSHHISHHFPYLTSFTPPHLNLISSHFTSLSLPHLLLHP